MLFCLLSWAVVGPNGTGNDVSARCNITPGRHGTEVALSLKRTIKQTMSEKLQVLGLKARLAPVENIVISCPSEHF